MEFSLPQFSTAMPEMFLLGMACLVLVVDVFVPSRFRFLTYVLVQASIIGAFVLAAMQFKDDTSVIISFSGNYVVDKLAILSKLFIYLFSFLAFVYARDYIKSRDISSSDYYLLGLLCVLGMSIMASANTFLTIYLGLELMSLALYAMTAMYKTSTDAIEAAMKYFVLGALASGVLLYGISLLFGLTGSIEVKTVGATLGGRHDMVTMAAMVFVMAGLAFKLGAVPFHMWVPDVYEGAPTSTTLFIASAPKIAAFAITLRILEQALPGMTTSWVSMLIVISILSMAFGNLIAIAQTNLKRLFAYSSIAHVGYALLGVLSGPDTPLGYSAAMFYIATYVLVAAGAFAIIGIMSRNGLEMDRIEDYRGLNARNPWLAFMMLLLLFSMAGVPPTVGFFAKLGVLESLVRGGYVWLAVTALVFAIVGAYYYLRVVMIMYFEAPHESANTPITMPKDQLIAISVNGVLVLVLGILPSYVIDLCRISFG